MTRKEKLKLALKFTYYQDFVPSSLEDTDVNEFPNYTEDELLEVISEYEGWGTDYITADIIDEYMKSNFEKPLPDFLYEKDGDIFIGAEINDRITEEYYEWVEGL